MISRSNTLKILLALDSLHWLAWRDFHLVHKFFFKMQLVDVYIFHILWEVFSVEKFQPTFPSLQILRYLESSFRWVTSFVGKTFEYRTDITHGFFSSYSEPNTSGKKNLRDVDQWSTAAGPYVLQWVLWLTFLFSAKYNQCCLQYWNLQWVKCITLNHIVWPWQVKWPWFRSDGITDTFYTSQLNTHACI